MTRLSWRVLQIISSKRLSKSFFVGVVMVATFLVAPQAMAVGEYACGTYSADNYGESCPDVPIAPVVVPIAPSPVSGNQITGTTSSNTTTDTAAPNNPDTVAIVDNGPSGSTSSNVAVTHTKSGDVVAVAEQKQSQNPVAVATATVLGVSTTAGLVVGGFKLFGLKLFRQV